MKQQWQRKGREWVRFADVPRGPDLMGCATKVWSYISELLGVAVYVNWSSPLYGEMKGVRWNALCIAMTLLQVA